VQDIGYLSVGCRPENMRYAHMVHVSLEKSREMYTIV
jgi:hypothetical protein